jgi:hypothetical protein
MAQTKSRREKQKSKLPDSLNRGLLHYAMAATAAGVASLACALPAEAAPVCTKTDIDLGFLGSYMVNPAQQKFAPFIAVETYNNLSSHSASAQYVGFFLPNSQNAEVVAKSNLAVPLPFGSVIGSGQAFAVPKSYGLLFTYRPFYRNLTHHKGNFTDNQPQYLGLKFSVSGETHYGWARFVWKIATNTRSAVHVTGYGYETTAGQSIAAGACGTEAPPADAAISPTTAQPAKPANSKIEMNPATVPSTPRVNEADGRKQSASLGWLAVGAGGLSSRR